MNQEERHHRVMEILADALECDTQAREGLIRRGCAGDETIQREVELLLRDHQTGAAQFLEEPLCELANPHHLLDEEAMVGKRIGAYRIEKVISRGGMGAVYLASRDDDEYHRNVAIKLVRPVLDSGLILRRFRNERQILASLDHQNIARLFDGGTTEDGLPYLVMEYVEGEPIDVFANSRKLSIESRLILFILVCEAVEYAHRRGVVHRDLKPRNILVTNDSIPKLLDFGIARVLYPNGNGTSTSTTLAILRGMTPEYASPEQIRGEAVSVASDIYSLGVLLYQLVTGNRPYHFRHASPYEISRVVCEAEPAKPSTSICGERIHTSETIARLRHLLTGDLDTVILKSLRKEPHRRYQSASEFAQDLRRHLEGLPILARSDTITYRARKFLARNQRATLTASLIAVLCLFAGVVLTLILTRANVANPAPMRSESLASAIDHTPRLIGWWPGDGNANDISGNGNIGTLYGGVKFVPGRVNEAFDFSDREQGVLFGNPAALRLQNFTISAWVKYRPRETTSNIFLHINGGYEFAIFGRSIPGGNIGGGIQQVGGLYLSRHGVSHVHAGNLTVPADGDFHHVVVTKSGSRVIFYVDAVPSSPVIYDEQFTFNEYAQIGGQFVGVIDEVKIFNYALPPSEIVASYNAGRCRSCEAVSHWNTSNANQ